MVPRFKEIDEDREPPVAVKRCYESSTVRERMEEFLGGADLAKATAAYIVGNDGCSNFSPPAAPVCLSEYLDAGMEIDRSLWDQDSLIADIDLEYHNFDSPVAAWLDPERAFAAQQPVFEATLRILRDVGVAPLTLLSGRGFHLLWAVSRDSEAFRRLVSLGRVPKSLEVRYAEPCSPEGLRLDHDLGRAYAGIGLIIEYVANCVMLESANCCTLSVQPTAIEVGPGPNGREIVSFDLSEYGDPLHTRHVRLPFSAYLKPKQFESMLGEEGIHATQPIFTIPLSDMDVTTAIKAARDIDEVLELSRHGPTRIPNRSAAMERLINQYEASELAAFHERFYGELCEPLPCAVTPGSAKIPGAPACVEWLLDHPNDWLLRPAALQHVVRVLTALNWRPGAIAQLIRACYEGDFNWGDVWTRLDPFNRAIFYTRLFAGMIVIGADRLIDLNCVSHKEKGFCMIPQCYANLVTYRDMLLDRRPL